MANKYSYILDIYAEYLTCWRMNNKVLRTQLFYIAKKDNKTRL